MGQARKKVELLFNTSSSEQRFRTLFEVAQDAILLAPVGADGSPLRLSEVNDVACRMTGYSREELLTRSPFDLLSAADRAYFRDAPRLAKGWSFFRQIEVVTKDGRQVPAEISVTVFEMSSQLTAMMVARDSTERVRGEQALRESRILLEARVQERTAELARANESLLAEVSERRRAEEALRENEALLQSFYDSPGLMRGIIETLDDDFVFVSANAVTAEFHGLSKEAMRSQRASVVGVPADLVDRWLDACAESRRTGQPGRFEFTQAPAGDRTYRAVITYIGLWPSGRPHFGFFVEDITEQRETDAKYLQAQRLQTLGVLAGGIAHDLNNAISPVTMAVPLLRGKLNDARSQSILDAVQASARRAEDIIGQVLNFARGFEGERAPLPLAHLIRENTKLVTATFSKSIEVEYTVAKDLWNAIGDATQIHQVLMNLCVNARDAMPAGGRLTLSAANVRLDECFVRMEPEARAGAYVVITVADTGEGIPREILHRIFDPFFTTKGPGKGTGLGLATVQSIIKRHGGFIQVESRLKEGTGFKIYLPAFADVPSDARGPEPASPGAGRGELILVVDDEQPIRLVTEAALQDHGYRVLTAAEGTEASALFATHRSAVKTVVIDLDMPEMDGQTAIAILQQLNPDVPIIVMSGKMELQSKFLESSQKVYAALTKPFTIEQLLHLLDEILHSNSSGEKPPRAPGGVMSCVMSLL